MRSSPKAYAKLLALAPLLALPACSGGDGVQGSGPDTFTPGSTQPGSLQPASVQPGSASGVTTLPPPDPAAGVSNYDRPLGMPIGQAPAEGEPDLELLPAEPGDDIEASDDIEIPVFVPMEAAPPCNGCVELNVDVNDINQRDTFVYATNASNVTRIVWTVLVTFNSDQLFVQPFFGSNYGVFRTLHANNTPLATPVQIVHENPGNTGTTVGLAVGSSGAWTGNMTMSVFIDSVTVEGADPSASRDFDTSVDGIANGSNAHNPKVVYHP